MYLTGGMQVCVPVIRQKYHSTRHNKIFDRYDDFNTYVAVGSLRTITNFGCSDVWTHLMTSEASRVVNSLSQNNNNTTVLSTLFVPYLH